MITTTPRPQKVRSSLTRRVVSSVAMLGSAQVVNILCSVVRTKFVALWLGAVGIGLNAVLVNGSNLISTATLLNLRDSAVRDIAACRTEEERLMKTAVVRRWALLLGLLGAIAMIVLSPLLSSTAFDGSMDNAIYFAGLAPAVFCTAYSAGEFAVLQAQQRLKQIAKANMLAGLVATAGSLPLLYYFRISAVVPVINLYLLSVAVFARIMRKSENNFTGSLTSSILWREGRGFMTLGFSLSVSMLMMTLMNYVFAAYISSSSGEYALGIYQSGYTLVNSYVGIIFSAVAVEYYPRLTRFVHRPSMSLVFMRHEMSLIVRMLTPVAIIFVLLSEFIIKLLYSSDFLAVGPFVCIAMVGALFRGVSLCYAYRILAAGDSKAFIFTEAVSTITGLALNITAYNLWSFAGLGVSYAVWYVFYAILTAAVCRHRYGVVLCDRIWLTVALSTVAIILTIIAKYTFF